VFGLGMKDDVVGAHTLLPLSDISDRPTEMPELPEGHIVVCGHDMGGLGERLFVCHSILDIQLLWKSYKNGVALSLKCYHCNRHDIHTGGTHDL